jgi:hypothetical protein
MARKKIALIGAGKIGARHPRLVEAHEQLVLGPETCWIGDCMQRDPAKCDAT